MLTRKGETMKSPLEIAAWNFFVPGVGYMMLGRKGLGAFALISTLVALYAYLELGIAGAAGWPLLMAVVGALDGYIQGAKLRRATKE